MSEGKEAGEWAMRRLSRELDSLMGGARHGGVETIDVREQGGRTERFSATIRMLDGSSMTMLVTRQEVER